MWSHENNAYKQMSSHIHRISYMNVLNVISIDTALLNLIRKT